VSPERRAPASVDDPVTPAGDGAVSELVRHRPAGPLRRYVAHYSGYRLSGRPPGRHRGLPSPYLTVIIALDDPLVLAAHPDPGQAPGRYDTLIGGLHTRPALITHPGRQSGIQVALSPLGARSLLGLPAGPLAEIDLPATDLLGPWPAEVRERLLAEHGWARRFRLLDALLLARLDTAADTPPDLVRAWELLGVTGGAITVAELAADLGWSTRHFGDRFRAELGLTPKAAARVFRFDRARRTLARQVAQGTPPRLGLLAAECGYYDQAHLARDFRDLAGCAPSHWLAEEYPGAG
jgi:AraC-like DNA-binding protein